MTLLLNWTGVRPLTSKSSVSFFKRFFGITIILFIFGNTVFANYANTEEKEKPGKPGAKKDSTDSSSANKDYVFKDLFESNNYNPAEPYVTQLRPEAVSFVEDYIRKQGKELTKMKGWAQPYFQIMDRILTSFGIPKEMKYLAVIESHLSSYDLSWAGAVGPWQFMPETGRLMGLRVDKYVDERTSHVKSTYAAAKYLRQLYTQLGDWLLVVAAYDGGPGRVFSAIRQSGSRDFWKLQNYLPLESRNHVKKFIGTHYIMEGNGGITTSTTADWNELQLNTLLKTTELRANLSEEEMAGTEVLNIRGKYNSLIIAKDLEMDIAQFNKLNPNFDMSVDSNDGYNLRLAQDKFKIFNTTRYLILHECIYAALQAQTISQYPSETRFKSVTKKKK